MNLNTIVEVKRPKRGHAIVIDLGDGTEPHRDWTGFSQSNLA